MIKGPVPIQVRARDALMRHMPDTIERKFILRWLAPRATKAGLKAAERASSSGLALARMKLRSEASTALHRADQAFSILVRTKWTKEGLDGKRRGRCWTCNRDPLPLAELQAGHYLSRRHYGTRWDQRNVHPQCRYCNDPSFGKGRPEVHRRNIDTVYGDGTADKLMIQANTFQRKPHRAELLEMEKKFKAETAAFLAREAGKI